MRSAEAEAEAVMRPTFRADRAMLAMYGNVRPRKESSYSYIEAVHCSDSSDTLHVTRLCRLIG